MKPRIIIGFSIIALIAIMFFMVMDFTNINKNQKNPYEYDIEKLKQVDPEEICYEQINKISGIRRYTNTNLNHWRGVTV